ncbi:ATP-binding cassette domain-containing protein [Arthrobacter sp. NPDC058127]|uniref:ATP-binding cassette domain-containing protein n=1 Tax=Arthrobacter sp. NPDC058127 TaxID=3346351 RepID=UPI0036F0D3A9
MSSTTKIIRDAPTVLSADAVTVRFGGIHALRGVDLKVQAGTVVGLIGPNGAGKSTLLGVLSGYVRHQSGQVRLDGELATSLPPAARVRRGLGRTFQQPEVFGALTVRDHLRLARRLDVSPLRVWTDPLTGAHLRPDPAEDAVVGELIELLGLAELADRPVGGLPLGVCRLVEIGRALATGPKVVLLDEPFSGLNATESRRLTDALARVVASQAVAMLLVEHDVDIVFELSSRVYVLDFGKIIAEGTPGEIRRNDAVRAAYLGEEQDALEHTTRTVNPREEKLAAHEAPVQLHVEGLTVRYGSAQALEEVTFSVQQGSVTALLGANGAGKSTLARALSGLIPVDSGRIEFEGEDLVGRPAHEIRRLGLAYLPEGRGVFPALTVKENLDIAVQHVDKRRRTAAISGAIQMFPVLGDRRNQLAGTLSGGEQQMLALARVLADPPKLLIADEVSLGLAPKIVDEVFAGLGRAIDMGVSLIVIEQFVHKALELADHCHFLRRGRLLWSGLASQARGEVMDLYLGTANEGRAEGIEMRAG